MVSVDSEKRSNGYNKRRFWTGNFTQAPTGKFVACTPSANVSGSIVWCPVTKKYYCVDLDGTGATVYARTPNGLWTLVHTGSGNGVGLFWSRRLGMIVFFTTTHIYTSTNGTDWTSRTVPASYAPTSMSCFCDANTYSIFISNDGSANYAFTTLNGITWVRNAISGPGSNKVARVGVLSSSDTVVCAYEASSAGYLSYSTNGTSFTNIVAGAAMYGYFPPTPLRQEHWYIDSATAYRSTDGINFSDASRAVRTGTFTTSYSFAFGGVLLSSALASTPNAYEFLNYGDGNGRFSDLAYGTGVFTSMSSSAAVTVQGEFLSQNSSSGYMPRAVGTWLEPGDYMCVLIGAGGLNSATTVGGVAGAMVRHKFTVTEKYRWIAYNLCGTACVVDIGGSDGLQADSFLAYASFHSYTTSPGPNRACFGDEVYYGQNALQAGGAACGPSGGYPSYHGTGSTDLGCGTAMTTSATTPNDWWDPEDWVGNPSGTGYPGTAGATAAAIGLLGASTGSTVAGSFGSGGCNTSTAFTTKGGEPLAIIYSN